MSSFGKRTRNPGWKPGSHWVECSRTGFLVRVEDARKEWTGTIVARDEWEPRHPQDMLRGVADDMSAKGLVNPESTGIDIAGGGTLAVAGWAVAGEAVAGTGFLVTLPTGSFAYPAGHNPLS